MSAAAIAQPSNYTPSLRSHDPVTASSPTYRPYSSLASPGIRPKPSNTTIPMALATPPGSDSANNNPVAQSTSRRSPDEDERAASAIQQLSAASAAQSLDQTSPSTVAKHGPTMRRGNSDPNTRSATSQLPMIIKKEQPSSPDGSQSSLPTAPGSLPSTSSTRQHRPKRLDLTNSSASHVPSGARTSAPLTSKDSATFSAMQDVGLLCLSPGIQTQDPERQEQLAKSMAMREQQRQIIAARNSKSANKEVDLKAADPVGAFSKPTSRRKGPPPGLSIHAPEARQFASEPRVVHSAPINQSFTGLRPGLSHVHPLSRQVLEHSHVHQHNRHAPPHETSAPTPQFGPITNDPTSSNRLPPIQDVFNGANESHFRSHGSLSREDSRQLFSHNTSIPSPRHPGNMQSPGLPPPASILQPPSDRQREFRSAEEAVQSLSGGRQDLLPKVVHYGGPHQAQPPTPPSPLPAGHHHNQAASQSQPQTQHESTSSGSQPSNPQFGPINPHSSFSASRREAASRRRNRDEYERDYPDAERMDIDGERERVRVRSGDWRDDETAPGAAPGRGWPGDMRDRERDPQSLEREAEQRRRLAKRERERERREEFLSLCARAWDLMHES